MTRCSQYLEFWPALLDQQTLQVSVGGCGGARMEFERWDFSLDDLPAKKRVEIRICANVNHLTANVDWGYASIRESGEAAVVRDRTTALGTASQLRPSRRSTHAVDLDVTPWCGESGGGPSGSASTRLDGFAENSPKDV